ncbi:MAG: flagellar basal body-associated FliL family protein [Verrucomicrobia bacterium]|nr:flagellar basal body-associated FliL family protein [Verrucomicrobiota bacterium]
MASLGPFNTRTNAGAVPAFVPVLLMAILMPLAAWFILGEMDKKAAASKVPEVIKPKKMYDAPANLAVPVVPGLLHFLEGDAKSGAVPRVVATNDIVMKRNRLAEIVVTLADKDSAHHAVFQLYVTAEDTDLLIQKINATVKQALELNAPVSYYDRVTNLISSKTIKEVQALNFRRGVREEIISLSNEVLGSNVVKEVIISKSLSK